MEIQETKITKTSSRERWRPRLTSRYLSEDNSFSFPFIALSPVTQHLPAPPCFPLLHPFWWICWVKGPTYQMSFLPLVTSLLYWTLSSQLPWEFNLPGSPQDSVRPLPAQLQFPVPAAFSLPRHPSSMDDCGVCLSILTACSMLHFCCCCLTLTWEDFSPWIFRESGGKEGGEERGIYVKHADQLPPPHVPTRTRDWTCHPGMWIGEPMILLWAGQHSNHWATLATGMQPF